MIKLKKLIISLALLICSESLYGQDIFPSVSNVLRYGSGHRLYGMVDQPFNYFENLTDLRISLPENFVIGTRFLYDNPPEVGSVFKGIKRRFIEYNGDSFYLRAGNSSTLFGRGLALNLFENRGLAYDTWMDGIKASYNNNYIKATILGGTIDFRDSINFVRNEIYNIKAVNFEVTPINSLSFGTTFISADGNIPTGVDPVVSPPKNINAEIPELYLSLNMSEIQFYFDWSHKWTNILTDKSSSNGSGIYSAFSFLGSGFGITIDYKNYLFDERDPYERNDFTRATRMLPFQNPPIVMKEQSSILLSRAIHEVDFNDEVGFQIEGYYSIDDNTTLNINTSLASRHNLFLLNPMDFSFSKQKRESNFLPSSKHEYSPYWEFLTEIEHYFDYTTVLRIGAARRTKTIYEDFSGISGSHIILSTVIPSQFQYTYNQNYSFVFQYEFEAVNDNYNSDQQKFNNQFISLTNSFFSKYSAAVRYEFTNNKYDLSGKKNWLTIEAGYRIDQSNTLTLSYGSERGGQTCSNGVCRYILPFKGLRLSFVSTI